MKIAIISDIHDNLENLRKFLSWAAKDKPDGLICCGDITNSESLEVLASGFGGKIYLAKGNIELYEEEELENYKQIEYFGKIGNLKIDGHRVGFCHEPYLIDRILESDDWDIIFYGHTHRPWIEDREGVKLVNPGTLGGVFAKATFAVWDTKSGSLELKILEDLKIDYC